MPRQSTEAPLLPAEIRVVAVLAGGVDPRTVAAYLSGKRNPFAAKRRAIDTALRCIKRADLVRTTEADVAA